jgi:hypothetical protein
MMLLSSALQRRAAADPLRVRMLGILLSVAAVAGRK